MSGFEAAAEAMPDVGETGFCKEEKAFVQAID